MGTPPTTRRATYSDEQKQLVREQYRYCASRDDKVALAQRAGLDSIEQLYNLANRLGVTRPHQEADAAEGIDRGGEAAFAPELLARREDPDARPFRAAEDDYLRRYFGRVHLERIAYHLDRPESAIAWRAHALGLREHCKYWPAEKIIGWTGMSREQLHEIGVDFFDCHDRRGRLAITLVSTSSLLRASRPTGMRRALEASDADAYLLVMLDELAAQLSTDSATWEPSRWISHARTCLNPWAGVSFLLFDDGTDRSMPGRELHPSDLAAERFPVLIGELAHEHPRV